MALWVLNIFWPGAGLVAAGRFREGLLPAMAFLLAAAVAIGAAGMMMPWLAVAGASLAGGVYAHAQVRFGRYYTLRRAPNWRLHVAAMREIAEAHLAHERYEEALSLVRRWIHDDRLSVDAHVLLGEIHQARGRPEEAERAFRRAERLDREGRHDEQIARGLQWVAARRR
ncbi:MAG: tetratricopeptide repeat protein [Planctomycetota bacterium]